MLIHTCSLYTSFNAHTAFLLTPRCTQRTTSHYMALSHIDGSIKSRECAP